MQHAAAITINMKKWILKAIVQKAISYLPFSHQINYIFQKYVTRGVRLSDDYFYDRLGHARDHIKAFSECSGHAIPETCLELGTGWYPVVPISMFLVGVDKIYSFDVTFLTSKERINTTIGKFLEAEQAGMLKKYIPYSDDRVEDMHHLARELPSLTLEQVLEKLNLAYLVGDARKLSLTEGSIDLVNSNNTFEHIYPEILTPILKEFKRVVNKQHGVMSHFIDMSDHFAHFDQSISIYNFLQYGDSKWKWIDNSIQPQSRLRIDDYREIYRALDIPITRESFRKGNAKEVISLNIDKKFQQKTHEVLAISHCRFVSRMKDRVMSRKS